MKRGFRILALVCTALLVATGCWYLFLRPEPKYTVSADFPATDGIFPGNKVQVLGVPMGLVRSLQPHGAAVRVTMDLDPQVRVPKDANAFIMNPAVISDRFVEIGPAYTGGPALPNGGLIPAGRSHAPVRWDQLMSSMDTILRAVGPSAQGGDLGGLLHDSADAVGGRGPQLRDALNNVASASDVVGENPQQAGQLIDNMGLLVRVLADNKSKMQELNGSVSQISGAYDRDQAGVNATIGRLSSVLAGVHDLVDRHGTDLTRTLDNVGNTASKLSGQQRDVAQALDQLPLTFDNFDRAVTPDQRLRIRLNISTNLSEFPATAKMCKQFPIPLCSGAGFTNPVPFPPHVGDPLAAGVTPGGGG